MIIMETKEENINLSERAESNPFHVPEGYFDQFPRRIMDLVETENKPKKEMLFLQYLRPVMGLAAGLIVIAIIVFFPFRILKPGISSIDKAPPLDEEYFISCSVDDQNIYETIESETTETTFDDKQLENVLLGSVNEYELIVLNDQL